MVSAAFPLQGDQGTITLLMVFVSTLVWTATVCYWLWSRPTYGAKVLSEFDDVRNLDFDNEDETGRYTTRCARLVAYKFKAEFGEMRYNKANKCIAGDWVRREFKEMGCALSTLCTTWTSVLSCV